ncbi:serine-rich adhesin for platelets [Ixodes scapularis]
MPSSLFLHDQEWMLLVPARHIFVLMGFLGLVNVYTLRVSLSVAIVAMVRHTEHPPVATVGNLSSASETQTQCLPRNPQLMEQANVTSSRSLLWIRLKFYSHFHARPHRCRSSFAIIMSFVKWCEYCAAEGIRSPVCLFQISFTEAMQVCKRPECRDLLMAGSIEKLILRRDLSELGEKNEVPPKTTGSQACLSATISSPKEAKVSEVEVVEGFLSSLDISTEPPGSKPYESSLCIAGDTLKPVMLPDCAAVACDGRTSKVTELLSLQVSGEPGAVVPEEDKSSRATLPICDAASLGCCVKPDEVPQVLASSVKLRSEGPYDSVVLQHCPDPSSASPVVADAAPEEGEAERCSVKRETSPFIFMQDFIEEVVVTEEQGSVDGRALQESCNEPTKPQEVPILSNHTSTSNEALGTLAADDARADEASQAEGLGANSAGLTNLSSKNDPNVRYGPEFEVFRADETAVCSSLRVAESICSLECKAPQSAKLSPAVLTLSLNVNQPAVVSPSKEHSLLLIGQTNTNGAKELTELGHDQRLNSISVQAVPTVNGHRLINGTAGERNGSRIVLVPGNSNAGKAGVANPTQHLTAVSQQFTAVPVGTTSAEVLDMLNSRPAEDGVGLKATHGITSRQDQPYMTAFTSVDGNSVLQQVQQGRPVASSNSPKRTRRSMQNSTANVAQAANGQGQKVKPVPKRKRTAACPLKSDNNYLLSKLALINTVLNSPASLDVHSHVPPGLQPADANGQPALPANAPTPRKTSSNRQGRKQGSEPKKQRRAPTSGGTKTRKRPNSKKDAKSTPTVADLKPVCSPLASESGSQSSKPSSASTSSGFYDSASSGSERKQGAGLDGDSATSMSSSMLIRLVKNQVRSTRTSGSGFPGYHPVLAKKPCYREDKKPCRRKWARSAEDSVQADDIDQRVAQLAGSEDLSQFDNVLADLFDGFV